jgi:WD40 repeat protein
LSNGKLLHTLADHSDWVHAVAFTSDSNALVSGSRDGSIKIWQSNLHSESQPVASQELPISFTQLIITIILVILAKFTAGISLAVPIFMLTKAHNNSKKKAVIPFESEVFKCVNTITEHSSSINSLAISPDGKILAIGSDDNTIKLWSPEQEKSLTSHSGFISSVAISPDGKTLASGSKDWVMLWNLKTGELLHSLQGNSRPKLSRIVVLPSQVRLEFGQSQIFNVRGLDQNGYEINIEQVTWQAKEEILRQMDCF